MGRQTENESTHRVLRGDQQWRIHIEGRTFEEVGEDVLHDAALMLVAKHDPSLALTIEREMREVASHSRTSGGVGSKIWVASLKALGEIIVSIAKREEAKNRAMNI